MERWVGKVAVVTGASSGIGEAIARDLVRQGMNVVGLARRRTKLENIEKQLVGERGKFHVYQCDVRDEKNVAEAFKWIKSTLGGVHVLVNNAGLTIPGTMIDMEGSSFKQIFDTNVLGLLYCTQQALRSMRETRFEGTIININSIEGHQVRRIPRMDLNVYPGSKHAVTAIVENLHHELREEGLRIRVTSLSPGIVATDIFSANHYEADPKALPYLNSEDVAGSVNYILSVPQRIHITELTIRPLGEPF